MKLRAPMYYKVYYHCAKYN